MPPAWSNHFTSSVAWRGESTRRLPLGRATKYECAPKDARIEPTAPHAVGDLLRKDRGLWPRLPRFAAYRRGWAHEYRTPGRKLFLGCRRLPREDAFAVSLDDKLRGNMARGATIDASGVDVPITRCGVGIASRLHRVFDSLRSPISVDTVKWLIRCT